MPSSLYNQGRMVFRRRLFLGFLTLVLTAAAALPVGHGLSLGGWSFLKVAFLMLFVVLVGQVFFSTLVALVGWWILRRGPDPNRINASSLSTPSGAVLPATAIVMPIRNENVARVFAGLRVMYKSLEEASPSASFDFFILSDTSEPNCWIAEEKAWFDLCKQVKGFGRIFYRKRRVQLHHKSGNVADFCRRWGANYRYMIVLDADSVMTGGAMVRLATLMEENPRIGILQTSPLPVFGQSLFQRIEQFAAAVYRPVFTAGANYWQLGDATYWGHNAIIRLRPFMECCAMPELPGVGPLGRRVMSHDTIEAALMRRGGFEVWQAYDLEGSYEECPPHLLAGLKRDRRWCHGNLQHIWFLFESGLKPVSRFNILNGILAYANSPIWFLSILFGISIAVEDINYPSVHAAAFAHPLPYSIALYLGITTILLLPKFLAADLLFRSPEKLQKCGGSGPVRHSIAVEIFYSMLLAPILMFFYSRFVLASLFGHSSGWGPQARSDEEGPDWRAWVKLHWANFLVAAGLTAWVWMTVPSLLAWLVPVLAGPLLAIPFSRWAASARRGREARAHNLFLTPNETAPPPELRSIIQTAPDEEGAFFRARDYAADYGLLQAVLDPYINAIHVSLLRQHPERSLRTQEYIDALANRLLVDGPLALSRAEKGTLLWEADAMLSMHHKLWSSPASHLHEWWQAAFRHYVESSELATRRAAN